MLVSYRKIFSGGWRQWETVKEDLVGDGGCPVPPARGELPGGFCMISVEPGFWDIYTAENWKKEKSAGDPMSLMVKYKQDCLVISLSRVMYAALQVAQRTLLQTAADGSFSAFLLPKAVHAKQIEIQRLELSMVLVFWISTSEHKHNGEHTVILWKTRPCEETIWRCRIAVWQFLPRWGLLFNKSLIP